MGQTINSFSTTSPTFGEFPAKLNETIDTLRSQFGGTSFPSSPSVGQPCFRTDRGENVTGGGVTGKLYYYSGNVNAGESGWISDEDTSSLLREISNSRGSKLTLDQRLDISINEDGTLKSSATPSTSEWILPSVTFAYITTTTFKTSGNTTDIYTTDRKVKVNLSSSYSISDVLSSVYDSGQDETVVTISDAILDNTLVSVQHGIISTGLNSSFPDLNDDASSITITDSGDYFDSDNIEDALQEIGGALTKTVTPTLSGNTSAPEGSQQIITITNYSATATYTINVESGSFVRDGANITWTLPAFTGVDDIHDLTVSAKDTTDLIESDTATLSMTVLDIESDQTILYEGGTINATTFPTVTNVDLSGNTIVATADGASATSAVVEQDAGDGDFVNAVPTMDSKAIGFGVYKSGADNTSTTTATEIHTADVGINGTASASTTADSGNLAHEAFDGDSTSQWSSSTPISWLQYQFNTAKAIDKVIIFNDSINSDRMIKDFTIKASNTGTFSGEEVTLTTVVGETNWGASESRIFTFTNSISYSYYRIDITANNGNVTYTHIAEVNFIESQAQYTNTSITVSGQTLTDGDTLLINDGASVDLIEFDTTGNVTDNGDSTYTLDLTSTSLTNAPTQVLKDVPTLSTSIVASGGADSFVERSIVTATADTDGTTTATEITTLFDADDRSGKEVKHQISMNDGDEVTRIQTPISKLI
jgi:hypothetical protein